MQIALPQEDIQSIMDELETLMIRHDYQRSEGTWYLFGPELLRIFDFQPGTYRPKAYFNLAMVVRTLDDSTRPLIFRCSTYGRLDSLVPDVERFELATDFGMAGMTTAERVACIVKAVEDVVIPLYARLNTVEDLRQFLRSPRGRDFHVRKPAKPILLAP